MTLSLRTSPGGKVRFKGTEGAAWSTKAVDHIEDGVQQEGNTQNSTRCDEMYRPSQLLSPTSLESIP